MAPAIPVPTQGGMFHTFQGVTPRKQPADSNGSSKSAGSHGTSKRITTPHACAECKRRKIRCDGQQPCGQCLSSRAPKRCFYDKHRQRVIPSRKTLEALSQSLEECRLILNRLYPHHDIQTLLPMSRKQLLGLLDQPIPDTPCGLPSPPTQTSPESVDVTSPLSSSEHGLCGLEQIPTKPTEWDEERRSRDQIAAEADDVNALSLSLDRQVSYLGASSIKAALMVMLKVQPALRSSLTTPLDSFETAHTLPVVKNKSDGAKEPQRVPWSWKGQTLIDAYFKRVHVFVPMLDEASFRADYLEGQRLDGPWLALLNAVFAMGSIVASKSDDYNHLNYYTRAMEHLPMDSLGSSQIETVQALALIGGYYLHYINRPNMANAVLGAAIRMASALGLHRESLAHHHTANNESHNNDIAAAETRRRTWWSLFCLDTWATTTMGRPSFGRWGPAVNIRAPESGPINGGGRDSAQHAGILPLIENIRFCKIATAVQDMLAISPLLRTEDRCHLDRQLVTWYSGLPWLLRATDPCAEPLQLSRSVMKWRYQNLRMLLHRPVLLSLASSGASHADEHDVAAIEACRELASQTIDDISREWDRNQMAGWNAVWFLYQAAMIPLVSLFWQWDHPLVPDWRRQVETVLDLLDAMEHWSLAAHRSREVVFRVYEASRQLEPSLVHQQQQQQNQHSTPSSSSLHLHLDQAASGLLPLNGSSELHMSPIGFAPPGDYSGSMFGMLDHNGLWDPTSMDWSLEGAGGGPIPVDDLEWPHQSFGTSPSLDYGMMPLDGAEGFGFRH